MRAFAWIGVEHPLHHLVLHLGLLHCWCCSSLVEVEKEVDDIHLGVLPHFIHLGVSHLWMPPCQLVVLLDERWKLPLGRTRYSPSPSLGEPCQSTSLELLSKDLCHLHQLAIALLASR